MPIKVLVASADLDVHELVADILEIIFKDITLDRVLDIDRAREKIQSTEQQYNLILLDYHLGDNGETSLTQFCEMSESVSRKLVMIVDGESTDFDDPALKRIPTVSKPFSLDEFDLIVRNVCK